MSQYKTLSEVQRPPKINPCKYPRVYEANLRIYGENLRLFHNSEHLPDTFGNVVRKAKSWYFHPDMTTITKECLAAVL